MVGNLRSCIGWPKEKKTLVIGVGVWRWGEAVLDPLRGKLTLSIIIQKCPHPITKRITSLNLQKRDIVGV